MPSRPPREPAGRRDRDAGRGLRDHRGEPAHDVRAVPHQDQTRPRAPSLRAPGRAGPRRPAHGHTLRRAHEHPYPAIDGQPASRGRRRPTAHGRGPRRRRSRGRSALLVRNRALLDRLDASLGDGDHGENMSIGFGDAVRAIAPDDRGARRRRAPARAWASCWWRASAAPAARCTARRSSRRGSPSPGRPALDAGGHRARARRGGGGRRPAGPLPAGRQDDLRRAAAGGGRGRARRHATGEDIGDGARRSRRGGRDAGMRATTPLVARRGLALRLGERSRGHQDPGATSCYLLVRAMLPGRPRR